MTRDQLERAILTSPHPMGRIKQQQRINGIEDYQHIGGPAALSNSKAAARLGVTKRTVERWRQVLREVS